MSSWTKEKSAKYNWTEKAIARRLAYRKSEHGRLVKKDYNLRKQYGINLEQYNQLLAEQNANCAICGLNQSEIPLGLAVDHNHKTNCVRGLLCLNCNQGIGKFKDDPELLLKAIGYLRKTDVL